jgi:hypothetical protein
MVCRWDKKDIQNERRWRGRVFICEKGAARDTCMSEIDVAMGCILQNAEMLSFCLEIVYYLA